MGATHQRLNNVFVAINAAHTYTEVRTMNVNADIIAFVVMIVVIVMGIVTWDGPR